MKELQIKYKNEKSLAKKRLSCNAKEIRKTGGGSANLSAAEDFVFSQEHLGGIYNRFGEDCSDNEIETECSTKSQSLLDECSSLGPSSNSYPLKRRVTYNETDTQLLIECVERHESILNDKNTYLKHKVR